MICLKKQKTIEEQCVNLYLCFYLIPKLKSKLIKVEAVILSLGIRSFTTLILDWSIELKVIPMKTFLPLPDNILGTSSSNNNNNNSDNVTLDENNEDSSLIENFVIKWVKDNKTINLHILKRVYLYIDVDYEKIPYTVYAFNIEE